LITTTKAETPYHFIAVNSIIMFLVSIFTRPKSGAYQIVVSDGSAGFLNFSANLLMADVNLFSVSAPSPLKVEELAVL